MRTYSPPPKSKTNKKACGTNSNINTALSEITNEGQFFFSIYKSQAAEYFSKAKHSYIFIQTHIFQGVKN